MRSTLRAVLAAVIGVSVLAVTSEAQGTGLDIGATAGVNIATVDGDDTDGAKNLTGFMVGLSFIHQVSSLFAFQPEIAYSMKGTKFEEAGETGEIKLAYIDVPLLAKISLGTAMAQARPALYIGPYAAINVGCDVKADGISFECDEFGADPKTVDFGAIAGVGLDFGNMNVFARYQFGLTNIGDEADAGDAKNRVIQIGGRWSFRGMTR